MASQASRRGPGRLRKPSTGHKGCSASSTCLGHRLSPVPGELLATTGCLSPSLTTDHPVSGHEKGVTKGYHIQADPSLLGRIDASGERLSPLFSTKSSCRRTNDLRVPWAESPEHRDLSCPALFPVPSMGLTRHSCSERKRTRPKEPQKCGVETALCSPQCGPSKTLDSFILS